MPEGRQRVYRETALPLNRDARKAPGGQAVSWRPCACSFAQVSRSVSVRLKTSAPGAESGSGQK